MPNATVKALAKKTGKNVKEVEKLWDQAKEIAMDTFGKKEKDFGDREWSYVTGTLKKSLGLKEYKNIDVKDFLNSDKPIKEYLEEVFNRLDEKKVELELPKSNLYFLGFGRDRNGNPVVKVQYPNSSSFSFQINNDAFKKTYRLKQDDLDKYSDKDLAAIAKEVIDYIQKHGSSKQKSGLKTY